jgi:hypothetical protein
LAAQRFEFSGCHVAGMSTAVYTRIVPLVGEGIAAGVPEL